MEEARGTPLTGITRTSVGPIDCIAQGWKLVSEHFGPAIGMVLLFYVSMFIPYGSIVLLGPAMCGIYYVFFKWMRGEEATVSSMFKGFEWMWDAFLSTLMMVAAMYAVLMIPIGLAIAIFIRVYRDSIFGYGPEPDPVILIGFVGGFYFLIGLVSMVVGIMFAFMYPLITERGLNPWQAMVWSVKGALPHFFGILGLNLLNGLASTIGFMFCIVPGILYIPVAFAANAYAFKKIYGLAERPDYRRFEERDSRDASQPGTGVPPGEWRPMSGNPPETGLRPSAPAADQVPEPPADERPATLSMEPTPVRPATVVEPRPDLPSQPKVAARGSTKVVPRDELPSFGTMSPPPVPPPAPVVDETTVPPAPPPVAPEPPAPPVAPEPPAPVADEPPAPEPIMLEESSTLTPPDEPTPDPVEAIGAAETRLMDTNPFAALTDEETEG
jgi:hypothetical protein